MTDCHNLHALCCTVSSDGDKATFDEVMRAGKVSQPVHNKEVQDEEACRREHSRDAYLECRRTGVPDQQVVLTCSTPGHKLTQDSREQSRLPSLMTAEGEAKSQQRNSGCKRRNF